MEVSEGKGRRTFGGGRRWLSRADFAIGVVLGLYVLLALNILAFRHPERIDLTRDASFTLSRATLDALQLVREEVLVLIPTFLQKDNLEHEVQYQVLRRARSLLDQYMAVQQLLRIAAEVDVFSRPDRWQEVRAEFGLSKAQVNRFILVTGASHEFRQTVTAADMAVIRESRDPGISMPEVAEFRGEKALTDAILRLIERRRRIVYFTQDKEELRIPATGRPDPGDLGANAFRRELETIGIEVRPLELARTPEIPTDAQALVIAGPIRPYAAPELEVLRRYLDRGGRLLVTLGPAKTGLEVLLEDWGVRVLEGQVQEARMLPSSGARVATDLVAARKFNAGHPITQVFREVSQFELWLRSPSALEPSATEKGRAPESLVETASSGDAIQFHLVGGRSGAPVKGDFTVAMAVTQRVPERPPPGFRDPGTRLVVIGASQFLGDVMLFQASHRDFVVNAIEWLLGEEDRATVGSQAWTRSVLPGDRATRLYLFWVSVGILPATFLALGFFVYYLRRS